MKISEVVAADVKRRAEEALGDLVDVSEPRVSRDGHREPARDLVIAMDIKRRELPSEEQRKEQLAALQRAFQTFKVYVSDGTKARIIVKGSPLLGTLTAHVGSRP